jgi:hypothetical protein
MLPTKEYRTMRTALFVLAFAMVTVTPAYPQSALTFEKINSSQVLLHVRGGGTFEGWVDNKLVVQEQVTGDKDYVFSATAVIEAFLNKESSSAATAVWIGSNQIFFDPPYDQAVLSSCTLRENTVHVTGKAATQSIANLVITTTPVVFSSQHTTQQDQPTDFTGVAFFQSPVALFTSDRDLGILVSATMWSRENIQLATKTTLVTPCQVALPLIVR